MALPLIGAALSMIGRAALTGLGGAARLATYSTGAGMRNAAFRALGRRARTRRRARGRRRAPLYGRGLMRKARRLSSGPAYSSRARRRQRQIRLKMGRVQRTRSVFNSLPANAPIGVRQRAQAAFQQAESSLQRMVDPGGGQNQMAEGLSMMVRAASNATTGLIGLATASYASSRGMELIGRQFAQYSGGYAAANAMLDVSRIRRTIGIGAATSDNYQEMIRSMNRLEEASKTFQIAAINIGTAIFTKLNNIAAFYLEFLNDTMPEWLKKLLETRKADDSLSHKLDPMTADIRNFVLNELAYSNPRNVNPRDPMQIPTNPGNPQHPTLPGGFF